VVQVPPGDLPSCDALIRQIGRIIVEPLSDHSFVSGR
jgi:hypothetical protein